MCSSNKDFLSLGHILLLINKKSLAADSDVNSGFRVIMTCHCRFISCEKCTTLVGDVVNGEGHVCVGSGGYEESLYFQGFREPASASWRKDSF